MPALPFEACEVPVSRARRPVPVSLILPVLALLGGLWHPRDTRAFVGENVDVSAQLSWSATATVTDLTAPGASNTLYVLLTGNLASYKGGEMKLRWDPPGDPDLGCAAHLATQFKTGTDCTYLNRGSALPVGLEDDPGMFQVSWANTSTQTGCTAGAIAEISFEFDGCADPAGTFTLCGLDVLDRNNALNHVV